MLLVLNKVFTDLERFARVERQRWVEAAAESNRDKQQKQQAKPQTVKYRGTIVDIKA